jgi:hypothetical protein
VIPQLPLNRHFGKLGVVGGRVVHSWMNPRVTADCRVQPVCFFRIPAQNRLHVLSITANRGFRAYCGPRLNMERIMEIPARTQHLGKERVRK